MAHDEQKPSPAAGDAGDWDAYWRGTAQAASHDIGGVRRAELARFWTELFTSRKRNDVPLTLLDVAAGSGAVLQLAIETLGEDGTDVTCVDYSPAAIDSLKMRFPSVTTCLADAGAIPLDDGLFAFVASQFGVEYAGRDAVSSVARLVAPGGTLAMLLHFEEGGIHEECSASVDAVQRMRQAQFIPLSIDLLRAGFARVNGYDQDVYEFAKRAMMPAVLEMKNILRDYGRNVAGGTIQRLYEDVAKINKRVGNYDQNEVIGWLQEMDKEIVAYEGRMSSMCDAAIGQGGFDDIVDALRSSGFDIERADALQPDPDWKPLAWALVANRVA